MKFLATVGFYSKVQVWIIYVHWVPGMYFMEFFWYVFYSSACRKTFKNCRIIIPCTDWQIYWTKNIIVVRHFPFKTKDYSLQKNDFIFFFKTIDYGPSPLAVKINFHLIEIFHMDWWLALKTRVFYMCTTIVHN